MIEILPFNKTLFDDFNLDKSKLTKYCYINDIDITSKLLTIELPISNTRIALKNIFDFLTYIDNKLSQNNNSTIIPISSSKLIEYFSRDTYKQYMDILSELNIITKVPYDNGSFYQPGSLYLQYRVHNNYINSENLGIIILDNDRSKDEFSNEIIELDDRYIKTIKSLEINIKEAIKSEIEYFKTNNLSVSTLRNRISRLFYTKRKRFIKQGKNVNRIYHSFSNVSKVSRKHINIKMVDVDIKNCQPLLLVYLLKNNNMLIDDNYQSDCEEGLFYENFIGINGFDRDQSKVALYKNIFFGFNRNSKFNKRFNELYPNTWNLLNEINNSDVSLASKLQNIESELFNNLIPKKSKHYFTLFDAIYFDNINDVKYIVKEINEFFNNLNIKVKTEIGL
ncbi:MAG: hypothetical protein ACOVK2_02895 [Candidatus Fonsibacter sp.]